MSFWKTLGASAISTLPLPGNMMPGSIPGLPGGLSGKGDSDDLGGMMLGGLFPGMAGGSSGGGMMGMLDPLGLLGGGGKTSDPNLQKMLSEAIMSGINRK